MISTEVTPRQTCQVGVVTIGIEILIAVKLEDCTMQVICACMQGVAYQSATRTPELWSIRIGIDAEFLDRLDSGNTCILIVVCSRIGRSIDQDIRGRGLGAIGDLTAEP